MQVCKIGRKSDGNNSKSFKLNCLRMLLLVVAFAAPSHSGALTQSQVNAQLANLGVEEIVFTVRKFSEGHWYTNIGRKVDGNTKFAGDGGGLYKYNTVTGQLTLLIDTTTGSIRDPAIHYDGQKMVFAWRKGNWEHYSLFECNVSNGNGKQRLTNSGDFDDIEPCYLPDGGIVFNSSRCKRIVPCLSTDVAVIHRCDADGSNIRPLSPNVEMDNTPWVMPDGRIIYMRWEYTDRHQLQFHHLWTMNPDGTDQMVYFGNMHPNGLFIDAKPIPGTDEVLYIRHKGHGEAMHAGAPSIVSDRNGPDDQSQDVFAGGYNQNTEMYDPYPITDNLFIASRGQDVVMFDRGQELGVVFTMPQEWSGGDFMIQEPRPVVVRQREPIIPSQTDWLQETGKIILSDAYLGRNMTGVNPGDIDKLLVLEILPKPYNANGQMGATSWGGTFLLERIIGTVPVEDDGSAYMEVPANRPLFFVAMDENDNAIKRMRSFTTVMPGETLSCAGCHEDRSVAPPQTGSLTALTKPANVPVPVSGVPEIYDFHRDIQPILDTHCVSCHGVTDPAGRVMLKADKGVLFTMSYANLIAKGQVADGRDSNAENLDPRTIGAVASPLMDKLTTAHHGVNVPAADRKKILYWIESGAPFAGTYSALIAQDGWDSSSLPTAAAMADAIQRRCYDCHMDVFDTETPLLPHYSEKGQLLFKEGSKMDPIPLIHRDTLFNFGHPAWAYALRAPLAESAGGWNWCGSNVFTSMNDPDYQAILNHLKAFRDNSPPQFYEDTYVVEQTYVDKMVRYGILPAGTVTSSDLDPYVLDDMYWRSFWHNPSSTYYFAKLLGAEPGKSGFYPLPNRAGYEELLQNVE